MVGYRDTRSSGPVELEGKRLELDAKDSNMHTVFKEVRRSLGFASFCYLDILVELER